MCFHRAVLKNGLLKYVLHLKITSIGNSLRGSFLWSGNGFGVDNFVRSWQTYRMLQLKNCYINVFLLFRDKDVCGYVLLDL